MTLKQCYFLRVIYLFLHAQDLVFLEDRPEEKHDEISGLKIIFLLKAGAKLIF